MKVLYVSGIEGAASQYEDMSQEEKDEIMEHVWKYYERSEVYRDENGIIFEVKDFEDVDEDFIDFIYSIQDYESSLNTNFYVIED